MEENRKCLAVIRVRGASDVSRKIEATLEMLGLNRNCHATLIDDRPSYIGMLRKARNYLTWGEISKDGILLLLEKRARLIGNKELTDEYAQEIGYDSLSDLAEAIYKLRVDFNTLPDIKAVFRLHPPKKGFKGKVKRTYVAGGVTGYRGETINELIKRMA